MAGRTRKTGRTGRVRDTRSRGGSRGHPQEHRLATRYAGRGPVEVVDLPPPGQVQLPEHKQARTIEDLHEALRELEAFGRRYDRISADLAAATGTTSGRERGHER